MVPLNNEPVQIMVDVRQAIIWVNYSLAYWRIYESHSLEDLEKFIL